MRPGRTLDHRRAALSPIRTRTVWYLHGFDPATTARYRRIFAAAAERFGVEISDLPDGGDGWQVHRSSEAAEIVTDIRYCRYEDLIRDYRAVSLLAGIGRYLRSVSGYAGDGALWRMLAYGPRSVFLALFPMMVMIFAPALIGVLVATAAGLAIGVVVALGLIALTCLLLRFVYLDIVADLFSYMRVLARADSSAWQAYAARIDTLVNAMSIDGTEAPEHEVLIVGHSLGGIAAIRAASTLASSKPDGAHLGLLTLGSVHGIVLAQRGAGRTGTAAALRAISDEPQVTWVDIGSPRDAFSLPLADPRLLIEPPDRGARAPLMISAQLRDAPRIPGDRRTAFAAMRRHMGYLLAPQTADGFDYADVITGPLSLHDRFAGRKHSPRARLWHR